MKALNFLDSVTGSYHQLLFEHTYDQLLDFVEGKGLLMKDMAKAMREKPRGDKPPKYIKNEDDITRHLRRAKR